MLQKNYYINILVYYIVAKIALLKARLMSQLVNLILDVANLRLERH